jgi:8-oxo-dGTP pyrophosphatase MutT (NUDIX family)
MEKVNEISAGGVLIRDNQGVKEALLIKVRYYGYELPKGHIEPGESPVEAGSRELCEETSLISSPKFLAELGELEYTFTHKDKIIHKNVYYFLFTTSETPNFGKKPREVKEIKWIQQSELEKIPLVNEQLRPIINKAFII